MQLNIVLDTETDTPERHAQMLRTIADSLSTPMPDGKATVIKGQIDLPLKPAVSVAAAGQSTTVAAGALDTSLTPHPAARGVPPPPSADATPSPAGDVERDVNGLPWDERIHSGSRGKNKDGTWRYTRGLDKSKIAGIEATLSRVIAAPAAGEGVHFTGHNMVNGVPPPPTATGTTFQQVLARVTTSLAAGELQGSDLSTKLRALGIENLPGLEARPDLWDTALKSLGV